MFDVFEEFTGVIGRVRLLQQFCRRGRLQGAASG
jgi:hypothetical protein